MTTSTIEEITAIAEPFGFEVPLQEPLPTGPTKCADTRLLEDFGDEEPVYGHWSKPGSSRPDWSKWPQTETPALDAPDAAVADCSDAPVVSEPTAATTSGAEEVDTAEAMPAVETFEGPMAEEPTACLGPLLPEEITNDLPPDSEIYHQAVGAFHAHLMLAGLAAVGLLAGVTVAVALAL